MFENSRLLLNLKQLPRIPETLDRFIAGGEGIGSGSSTDIWPFFGEKFEVKESIQK